jgi:hypothetical protein
MAGFRPDARSDPLRRFAQLARSAKRAVSSGQFESKPKALVFLGGLLNFAIAPGSTPLIRPLMLERLELLLGGEPDPGASPLRQYHRHLEFLKRVHARLEPAAASPDMLVLESAVTAASANEDDWARERKLPQVKLSTSRFHRPGEIAYLSACAIYRDQAPYLREWIEFHRLVGVERFFLYDNDSSDHHREVLEPYLDGLVTLQQWPVFPGQEPAYDHCIEEQRTRSRWIAFLDLDEFLFSPTGSPVSELLAQYERFPAVGVNWVLFGSSGHNAPPAGLVIENYVHRQVNPTAERLIKTIVDPKKARACDSAHSFLYLNGHAVNENMEPIDKPPFVFTDSPSWSRLRINHYITRSEQEYRRKLRTRRADTGTLRPLQEPPRGHLTDEAITAYVPALKRALARTGAG